MLRYNSAISRRLRIALSVCYVIFTSLCLFGMIISHLPGDAVAYSNNITQAQYDLNQRVSSLISFTGEELSTYAGIASYVQRKLNSSLYSEEAIAAQSQLELNPDLILPMYYKLGVDEQLKLMGAVAITEIAIPSPLKTPCNNNPLFEKLNISCMPEYAISTPGRLIRGTEAGYSALDGTTTLVYNLSTYSPSTNSRLIAIEFNVFDTVSANIAVGQIVFERSRMGNLISKVSVVTIPQHFVYFGGMGTMSEWLGIGGLCVVAVGSLIAIFTIIIRRIRNRSLSSPAVWEIALIGLAALCLASFTLQLLAIMSNPLADLNLGLKRNIDLSEIAEKFTTVNGINAVIVMCLFGLFLTDFVSLGTFTDWCSVIGFSLIIWVALAAVLNVRFADCLSFSNSVFLLAKIGIRYVSRSDFEFLWQNGFAMASLLVFHAMLLYWATGVVVGIFLGDPPSPKPCDKKNGEKPNPVDSQEPSHEQTLASVEVFAGKMLGDVTAMKDQIEADLQAAREELVEARAKIGQIRQLVLKS